MHGRREGLRWRRMMMSESVEHYFRNAQRPDEWFDLPFGETLNVTSTVVERTSDGYVFTHSVWAPRGVEEE